MPSRPSPLSTWRWQALRARVIAEETTCGLCGLPVDRNLPGTHPDGPVVDHIVSRVDGGDIYARPNLQLAHNRCNNRKENQRRARPALNTSRDW